MPPRERLKEEGRIKKWTDFARALPPSVQNPADNYPSHCADGEDRRVGLGHDRIGQAKEEAEHETNEPSGPGELHAADGEADREPAGKRAEQRGALVRELHRQHERDRDRSEDEAAYDRGG